MKDGLDVMVTPRRLGTLDIDGNRFAWFELKEFKGAAFGFNGNDVRTDAEFTEILNSVLSGDGECLKEAMENEQWGVFKTSEDGLAYMVVATKILRKEDAFLPWRNQKGAAPKH